MWANGPNPPLGLLTFEAALRWSGEGVILLEGKLPCRGSFPLLSHCRQHKLPSHHRPLPAPQGALRRSGLALDLARCPRCPSCGLWRVLRLPVVCSFRSSSSPPASRCFPILFYPFTPCPAYCLPPIRLGSRQQYWLLCFPPCFPVSRGSRLLSRQSDHIGRMETASPPTHRRAAIRQRSSEYVGIIL
jgi:hypothetical protein